MACKAVRVWNGCPLVQDGFMVTQVIYLFTFIVHFYYYYVSSTSDHQALDPGGWGPLL